MQDNRAERAIPDDQQSELSKLRAELAAAREQIAEAEYRATTLQLQLDVANRRIVDLADFVPRGNEDPLLQRIGIAKAKVGRTAPGRWLKRLYRRAVRL